MISERNSIGYEIDENLEEPIKERFLKVIPFGNSYIEDRANSHISFINDRIKQKGPTKYHNEYFNTSVITSQEKLLKINKLNSIKKKNQDFIVSYNNIKSNSNSDQVNEEVEIKKKSSLSRWIS